MSSLPGFEPGTFGLEVQRAIHCATGTFLMKSEKAMQLISRESSQCWLLLKTHNCVTTYRTYMLQKG